jgi:hypothetical protein
MGDSSIALASPANEQIFVLPLLLKEKVAALFYADGGDGERAGCFCRWNCWSWPRAPGWK